MAGPDGEVFWYRGEDGVSDIGTDGNGHDGTYQGNMTTVSDDGKLAFTLDGTGDYMTLPTITMTGARTISLWFKRDAAASSWRRMFQFGVNKFSAMTWTGTDKLSAYYAGGAQHSTTLPSNGVWHHLTVEHDGSTSAEMFLNDSSIHSWTVSAAGFTETSCQIGASFGGQTWWGLLDEIKGFDRKISDAERTALASARGDAPEADSPSRLTLLGVG